MLKKSDDLFTGDRVWRMPLWKMFTEQMKESGVADLNNISSGDLFVGGSKI
jgi:leucyl aminopeptidase